MTDEQMPTEETQTPKQAQPEAQPPEEEEEEEDEEEEEEEPEEEPEDAVVLLIQAALKHQGTTYAPGGRGPDIFDGAGLITVSARECGLDLGEPHYTDAKILQENCEPITVEQVRAGDLAFFWSRPDEPPTDVALCLGDDEMLVASPPTDVDVAELSETEWQEKLHSYGRPTLVPSVPPSEAPS